ncbi:hypothetical protein JQ600_20160 [Bradyrhizobium sp. AUGA SZCCT0176]|uniref:hypothetical protein n=1 Tax=Bradyrhizobium sp. AUGA SZCCT0176 TaxID=2807664 RepID=UPI001BA57012|nr:hypothetical protein [Bradyrhizobium sp. AUGA SZCCT0176]MBR1227246.1 hypothetical protein [Bradyrhizobium sp. AUGA SZCCT0176]
MEKVAKPELSAAQLARPLRVADLAELMATIAPTIGEFVERATAPLRARILELEKGGIRYEGTWQAAREYRRGMMATYSGGLFHCNADSTRDKPGTSTAWTLAVKSGGR